MAIANTRSTVGSLLGLVATTANTATGVVDTAAQAIGIAASYVEKAAREQKERHALDAVDFTVNLIQERAQATALRKTEVAKFRSQSTDHAKFYDEAQAMYLKALRPEPEAQVS